MGIQLATINVMSFSKTYCELLSIRPTNTILNDIYDIYHLNGMIEKTIQFFVYL